MSCWNNKGRIKIKTEEELGLLKLLSAQEAKEREYEPDGTPKLIWYDRYQGSFNLINGLNEARPLSAHAYLFGEEYIEYNQTGEIGVVQSVQFYKRS